ncbi:DNA ligase [Shewanella sp. phage 1/40]|uniref:DNA ligase n=1 Tax=Shewanella sp. phage 1/40 TaxID=1458860 RepID=UPI0004F8F27D|nr:DNA ligase [Shewanella sp. phage 1/40]AHK11428.1 DNA ligase [Shewanella sp. phage 1/40]
MSEVSNILKMVADEPSKNGKEKILQNNKSNTTLKLCFELAYSPTINFYMKQIPPYLECTGVSILDAGISQLIVMLADNLRGHAAQAYVSTLLTSLSIEDAEVIINILKGDLRCGVGQSTINKVWKGLIVTPPRQGAVSMSEKALAKITYPAAIELKSDGSYCATVCGVSMMSRNGNPITGLSTLERELSNPLLEGYVLEGELVFDLNKGTREQGNGVINKIIKGTATKEECDSVYYQVWDIIDAGYYTPKGKYPLSNDKRRLLLEELITGSNCEKVKLIPRTIVNSLEEAHAVFEGYVRSGFEGAILKQLKAPWTDNGKPSTCVKLKRKEPADLEVVGIYEGEGKAAGSLGGLILESSCGGIKVNCGSGFSDEQRRLFWNEETLVGKVVEVEYDSITQNKDTLQHSLFLPIFKQVRYDKCVADSKVDIESKQKLK